MNHHHRHDTIFYLFILFNIIFVCDCTVDSHDSSDFKDQRSAHLQERNFGEKDYVEYPDADERLNADASSNRDQAPAIDTQVFASTVLDANRNFINISSSSSSLDSLDSHIKWDKDWLSNTRLGQLSAIDIDPNGNIAIFSRRHRRWDGNSFGVDNKFDKSKISIYENVVFLFDKRGRQLSEWGKNMFYMPHGLTIDSRGNYWLTDVAMHQVFKFDKNDIDQYLENIIKRKNHTNQVSLVASLVLGVAFEPGNDAKSFCKPTAVAVAANGDFFVSDGYCNSRIIKFNSKGEKILQFGRAMPSGSPGKPPSVYAFYVPHALALAEEMGILFVADRENGRILSFYSTNGTFHKEYTSPAVGTKVYSIAYADRQLYAVNGHDNVDHFHVRGFIIDVATSQIVSQFGPGRDMLGPHDIAVTKNATEIYVVELNVQKAYRFIREPSGNLIGSPIKLHVAKSAIGDNDGSSNGESSAKTALLFFTSAVIITGLCVAVAAMMAKCRKRGDYKYKTQIEFTRLIDE